MEIAEISDRLDYLLVKSGGGYTIDEYQKSLFLTSAQMEFVKGSLAMFEYGEGLRHVLGPLISKENITSSHNTKGEYILDVSDKKILGILWEIVGDIPVIPLDFNDKHFVLNNPFRKPDTNIAYRMTMGTNLYLYTTAAVPNYSYIYCKEPDPIILESLLGTAGAGVPALTIGGRSTALGSILPDSSLIKVIEMAYMGIVKAYSTISQGKKEETSSKKE